MKLFTEQKRYYLSNLYYQIVSIYILNTLYNAQKVTIEHKLYLEFLTYEKLNCS